VVSNSGQNLRLHPDTGAVAATDMPLSYADADVNVGRQPSAIGAAYTNNFAGTTGTTLYDIEAGRGVLVAQSPPNDGKLNTIGALGVDVTDTAGFDIATGWDMVLGETGDTALAALQLAGGTQLYSIDLQSGQAWPRGMIGSGEAHRDRALAPAR
jgi:hypothetical protein